MECSHTSFILNKLPKKFGMMDTTIIENEKAAGPRVGIGERDLAP